MIYAKPDEDFTALLNGADTGLVGTLTYQVERPDGSTWKVATTTGIVEVEPGSYVVTAQAPADAGMYVIVWKANGITTSEELVVTYTLPIPEAPTEEEVSITPTIAEVAALLRARTKDTNGNEVGTFNGNTRPTNANVEVLIGFAVDKVQSDIGGALCADAEAAGLPDKVRNAGALYAAMLVELSYFPEQVAAGRSPYDKIKELWAEDITILKTEVAQICGVGSGEGASANTGKPAYDFSQTVSPLGQDFPSW